MKKFLILLVVFVAFMGTMAMADDPTPSITPTITGTVTQTITATQTKNNNQNQYAYANDYGNSHIYADTCDYAYWC